MGPVRIGVLGCADIARRRVLPAMASVPGVEVAAVASRNPAKAAELAARFCCRPVTGYAPLVELPGLDAVYIPLPTALHADWAEAALRAGKHVLAEKPVSTDPRRTRALFELARTSGLALMENVMFVHHRQHAQVRRLVADGAIGELRSFHAAFAVPERAVQDIRYARALGGGALWDTGVYPVRAALHFLGSSLSAVGAVLAAGAGREVSTSGSALLRTASGVSAQLTFGLDHGYLSAYTLWGSLGRLTVSHAFTPPARHVPVLRLDRGTATELFRLEPEDQVAGTVSAFAAAVRAGVSPERQVTVRQAELLDQIAWLAAAGGDRHVPASSDFVRAEVA